MNSCVFFLMALTCIAASGISSFPRAKHGPVGYHGPLAKPVVLKNGHIALAESSHGFAGGYGGNDNIGAGYGGGYHGVYSYGPGSGDVYKGEHGYAGLHSVPNYKPY